MPKKPSTVTDAPPRASDVLVEALTACVVFSNPGARAVLHEAMDAQAATYPLNWRKMRRESKLLTKLLDAVYEASGVGLPASQEE